MMGGGSLSVSTDDTRLRQMEEAIAELRREERAEMKLREEEDKRRAAFDTRRVHLAEWERRAGELRSQIAEKESHLRINVEQELRRARLMQIDDVIETLGEKLASVHMERDELCKLLP